MTTLQVQSQIIRGSTPLWLSLLCSKQGMMLEQNLPSYPISHSRYELAFPPQWKSIPTASHCRAWEQPSKEIHIRWNYSYTSPKQTWNLKMDPWKRRFLLGFPSFPGSMLNLGGVSSMTWFESLLEFSIAPSNSWPRNILGEAFCGLRDAMDGKGFSKLCKAGRDVFFWELEKKTSVLRTCIHVKLGKGLSIL